MLWQGRLERHSHRTIFSKGEFVLAAQEQQSHWHLVCSAGIHGELRGSTFCGHSMLHHSPSQPPGLWDALTLMLPCLWKVSREIIGQKSVRNKAEEIFPWSLGLCCWAQPHLWDLSWERHCWFMPRSALFTPKSSVRHLFTTVPPCAHTSSSLSTLMDQGELCSVPCSLKGAGIQIASPSETSPERGCQAVHSSVLRA